MALCCVNPEANTAVQLLANTNAAVRMPSMTSTQEGQKPATVDLAPCPQALGVGVYAERSKCVDGCLMPVAIVFHWLFSKRL